MSQVTIVAATSPVLAQLLDVMTDWASLDLINEVFLVDLAEIRGRQLPATKVLDSQRVRVLLGEELATRHDIDLLRLCLVEFPGEESEPVAHEDGLAVREAISRVLPSLIPTHVHLLAARDGLRWPVRASAWPSWHNIVIAPENSASPTSGIALLVGGSEEHDVLALSHTVASVCGLLGLFAGHEHGVFDRQPEPSTQQLQVARTFVRFLSGDALEADLLKRTTDVADRYPVPRYDGAQAHVVEDELGAAAQMASALWDKHPAVPARPRVVPQLPPRKPIGVLEALRLFFTFLGAAIRRAPREFALSMVNRAQLSVAGAVQNFVFGAADPAYSVVVRGVTLDGRPADSLALEGALDSLGERVGTGASASTPVNLAGFWEDFVGGALTLLDGGTRGLKPLTVGETRAVVNRTEVVVPRESYSFGPEVAPYLAEWPLEAGDYLRGRLVHAKLTEIAREHGLDQAVAEERRDLQQWEQSRNTYAGRVGDRLACDLVGTLQEIEHLTRQLQGPLPDDLPPDLETSQRSLARRIFVGALIAVAVSALVIGLSVKDHLDWWIALLITLFAGASWVTCSTWMFVTAQRRLFELLHQRENTARLRTVLREHLIEALDDARRLNRGYRQFLDWVKALGTFTRSPLGRASEVGTPAPMIGAGLPRNVVFGVAAPTDVMIAEVADRLRRNLFEVAWLEPAWEHFQRDLPTGLGEWQYQLREKPELIWSDSRVSGEGSLLSLWSRAVVAHDGQRGVPVETTTRLRKELEGLPSESLQAQVIVRRPDNGLEDHWSYTQFVAGLDAEAHSVASYFEAGLFAEPPVTDNPRLVSHTEPFAARTGLRYCLVLTQLSARLHPEDLASATEPEPKLPEDPTTGFKFRV